MCRVGFDVPCCSIGVSDRWISVERRVVPVRCEAGLRRGSGLHGAAALAHGGDAESKDRRRAEEKRAESCAGMILRCCERARRCGRAWLSPFASALARASGRCFGNADADGRRQRDALDAAVERQNVARP